MAFVPGHIDPSVPSTEPQDEKKLVSFISMRALRANCWVKAAFHGRAMNICILCFIPIKTVLQMTGTETGGVFYFSKMYFYKVDGDLGTVWDSVMAFDYKTDIGGLLPCACTDQQGNILLCQNLSISSKIIFLLFRSAVLQVCLSLVVPLFPGEHSSVWMVKQILWILEPQYNSYIHIFISPLRSRSCQ